MKFRILSGGVLLLSLFWFLLLAMHQIVFAASPTITFNPASGPPGTSVTITGTNTNFTSSNVNSVNFGVTSNSAGQAAQSFQVNSTTQIVAVAPANVATGKIRVKYGQTVTSANVFTVTATPPADASSFTFTADSTNLPYNGSTTLHWTATNSNWCYGTGWSTLTPGSDNFVQPPDQSTQIPGNVSSSVPIGPLTSSKTFTLKCGKTGETPTPISIPITVAAQPASASPAFNFQVCKADGTGCVTNGGTINVNYNADNTPPKVILKWSATNVTWCWGYHWSTLPLDSDGSGWVQPPDQTTALGTPITEQQYTYLGLTSNKSFSLDCGQPGNPAALQTINVAVGPQALQIKSFSPTYGATGTNVVITGTGFTDVKYVKFNVPANDNSCSKGTTVTTDWIKGGSTTQIIANVVKLPNNVTLPATGFICLKNGSSFINSSGVQPPNKTQFTVIAAPTIQSFTADSLAANNTTTLHWQVTNATWCWGNGFSSTSPDSSGWVQPPDQNSPRPPTGATMTGSASVGPISYTTTYQLQCGTEGAPPGAGANGQNPSVAKSVQVTVNSHPGPNPPTGKLPFIKVNGGDVFAGGWFSSGGACVNQDPSYQAYNANGLPDASGNPTTKGPLAGGIITYGMAPTTGSGSTLGVFSLGGIADDLDQTNNNPTYARLGFMSNGANQLSFANNATNVGINQSYWGGLFEGPHLQSHCIPDYAGTKIDLPKSTAAPVKLNSLSSGQYHVDAVGDNIPIEIVGATIDTKQNVTIFVNGNAYISDDITYNTDKETINDVPKLAIVVIGNLYIDPKVQHLDGFYIAQPMTGEDCGDLHDVTNCHGRIFTCHDRTADPIPATDWLSRNCRKQLTINGALAAADIEFDRTGGDMTAFDPNAHDNGQPAEIVNFTPEMILGGSFFHGPSSSSSNQTKIDSIISLPPVY